MAKMKKKQFPGLLMLFCGFQLALNQPLLLYVKEYIYYKIYICRDIISNLMKIGNLMKPNDRVVSIPMICGSVISSPLTVTSVQGSWWDKQRNRISFCKDDLTDDNEIKK